jgi:hypothetical protein
MLLPRAMEYVTLAQGDLFCTRMRNSAITKTYSSSTLAKDPTDRTAHISVYMAAPYCQGDTPPRVPGPVGIHYQTPHQHNNYTHLRVQKTYFWSYKWHGLSHRVMAATLLPRAMEYVTLVHGDLSCTRVCNSAITRTNSSATLAKDPTVRTAHITAYMAAPHCRGDTPPRVPTPVGIPPFINPTPLRIIKQYAAAFTWRQNDTLCPTC